MASLDEEIEATDTTVLHNAPWLRLAQLPERLAAAIRKRTGLRFDLPVRNVGAQRKASDQHISNEDMALLQEMCEFETTIYETARERALGL